MDKKPQQSREGDSIALRTCNSDFVCTVHYPKENPEGAEEAITKTMAYLGVFEGIHPKDKLG